MSSPETDNREPEKRRLFPAVLIPCLLALIMLLIQILQTGMDWDFHRAGIFPLRPASLGGIFSMPFVHADWAHLATNLPTFILLTSALYYFYPGIASRITLLAIILSGSGLWLIGRDNWHVGASALIYALAFFLAISGAIRRHIALTALSFVVIFCYGSIVWQLFPWQPNDPVSWEGHLTGAISGLLLAIVLREKGPQTPPEHWEDEDENIPTSTSEVDNKEFTNEDYENLPCSEETKKTPETTSSR